MLSAKIQNMLKNLKNKLPKIKEYFKEQNSIVLILLIACGILGGGLLYSQLSLKEEVNLTFNNLISESKAREIGLAYINESLLPVGIEAVSSGEVTEEKGLYKFKIEVADEEFFAYISKDGEILFPQGINVEKAEKEAEEAEARGNFQVSEDELCLEDGKLTIYFFSSETCPHCSWEKPIIEKVVEKFGDYVSFHNNIGIGEDMEIFEKYSTGGVPTLVLGCKYFRVGSGENLGEEKEEEVLTSLICELTGNQPSNICQ